MKISENGFLDDDGINAEDAAAIAAKIEAVHSFFHINFKPSDDPLSCMYLTSNDILLSLLKVFPGYPINVDIINSWMTGTYRRKDIGTHDIKVVWAISRKIW